MLSLGIESTAHTFGIGIVDDKNVLINIFDIYKPERGWGIKPIDAKKHHEKIAKPLLNKVLNLCGIKLDDIDIISFSQGPGLPPCLIVGRNFSLEIAKRTRKPMVGVNHCVAHIEIGRLFTKAKDPVTLYVSGGNTQIIAFSSGKYRVFGETQDIGIGNALDKFGRVVGMEFPSGPEIERMGKNGEYIEIPYVVKGMDLSFSGIITEAIKKYRKGKRLEDICFSLQETMFAMVTEVTERALAHTEKNEVLLTGGVAANKRLQEMLKTMCKERGAKFFVCPKEYAGDNGVMIAWTGILVYKGCGETKDIDIKPRWRTDDVNVTWR